MDLTDEKCIFYPTKLLKHSKQGRKPDCFVYRAYPDDDILCPVNTIKEYLNRRQNLQVQGDSFLFTYGKPHRSPHSDTIKRWVKEIMSLSGIYTDIFKPHSCRSASTSSATALGVLMDTILKHGCWSQQSTLIKHYLRELQQTSKHFENEFEQAILDGRKN